MGNIRFKIIFGLILVFLFIIPAIFALLSKKTQNNNEQEITGSPIKLSSTLVLQQISPFNGQTSVGIYSPVIVTFSRILTSNERNLLKISSSPSVSFYESPTTNSNTMQFTHQSPFNPSTTYKITLQYGQSIYITAFTTIDAQNVPQQDQQNAQSQADRNYGSHIENRDAQYPWYSQLPLQTNSYFVSFDLKNKVFIAQLYPQKVSATSVDDQVTAMKAEIVQKLQDISADTQRYQIQWQVTPEL